MCKDKINPIYENEIRLKGGAIYTLRNSLDIYRLISIREKELKGLKGLSYTEAKNSLEELKDLARKLHLGLNLKVSFKDIEKTEVITVKFPRPISTRTMKEVLNISGYSIKGKNECYSIEDFAEITYTNVYIQNNDFDSRIVITNFTNL